MRVLATLDHPNIVTYYDSFEKDGVLMIEMEYADGGNLADFLAKKTVRMEEKEIINIFGQIVSAIRHMHDNNVLHRDLKTANIFLTKESMVKNGATSGGVMVPVVLRRLVVISMWRKSQEGSRFFSRVGFSIRAVFWWDVS